MDIASGNLEPARSMPVERPGLKVKDFEEAARYRGFFSRESGALRLRDGQVRRRGSCFRLFNPNVGEKENRHLRQSLLDAIRHEYGNMVADMLATDLVGPRGEKSSNLGAKEVRAAMERARSMVPELAALPIEPPRDHFLKESAARLTLYDGMNSETITVPQCAISRLSKAEREAASARIQAVMTKGAAVGGKFPLVKDHRDSRLEAFLKDEFRNIGSGSGTVINGRLVADPASLEEMSDTDAGKETLVSGLRERLEELYPDDPQAAERALTDLPCILHQYLTAEHMVDSRCIPDGKTQRPWSITSQATRFRITREAGTRNLLVSVSEHGEARHFFYDKYTSRIVTHLYQSKKSQAPCVTLTSQLEIRYRYRPPEDNSQIGAFEVVDDIERIEFRKIPPQE